MRTFSIASLVLFSFAITACSGLKKTATNEVAAKLIIYPSPPDPPRIQYLTSFSSSKDILEPKSAFYNFVIGEEVPKPITKPYGIFINNGKIYICDTSIGGLIILDLESKSFEYFIPTGLGKLKLPLKCFVDANENLYIADGKRQQIVVFDRLQNYLTCFGDSANFKPTDVFLYNNRIFVPNPLNKSITVFNKDSFEKLYSFPKLTTKDKGFLYSPLNIFVQNNIVYVSDFGDFKIKKYTLEGSYISSVGSFGRNLGQFVRPKGIAVDNEANLYVVDAGFENVQLFNKKEQLLMYFGGPYNEKGDMWLPSQVCVDYANIKYFKNYVDKNFKLKYLILVSNQFGPDKINIYGAIELKK